jgi:hypothetical protein
VYALNKALYVRQLALFWYFNIRGLNLEDRDITADYLTLEIVGILNF